MLISKLLKQNFLANTICKNNFKNEYVNMYINKKQLKITNLTCCKYCKGTGWIMWKTNTTLEPIFSYSLCYKCNKCNKF